MPAPARAFRYPALAALAFLLALAAALPAKAQDALKSARWLAARLPAVTVLDVREKAAFRRGHIPGALNIPFSAPLWRTKRYGVPGYLPAPQALARALGHHGLSRSTLLIIVSAGGSTASLARAARVFWSLRLLGHERLWLLDGGMTGWRGRLRPGPQKRREAARYVPRPDLSILATLEQTQDALDNNVPPIDARGMDHFYGYRNDLDDEDGGTILDAVNVPAAALLDGKGRFLPPAALREAFAGRGAVLDQGRLVTFSTWGVRAAVDWFALHEILHIPDARLYDGSLAEWAAEGMDLYDSTDGMGGVIGG